jgi:hypothetical protein
MVIDLSRAKQTLKKKEAATPPPPLKDADYIIKPRSFYSFSAPQEPQGGQ